MTYNINFVQLLLFEVIISWVFFYYTSVNCYITIYLNPSVLWKIILGYIWLVDGAGTQIFLLYKQSGKFTTNLGIQKESVTNVLKYILKDGVTYLRAPWHQKTQFVR